MSKKTGAYALCLLGHLTNPHLGVGGKAMETKKEFEVTTIEVVAEPVAEAPIAPAVGLLGRLVGAVQERILLVGGWKQPRQETVRPQRAPQHPRREFRREDRRPARRAEAANLPADFRRQEDGTVLATRRAMCQIPRQQLGAGEDWDANAAAFQAAARIVGVWTNPNSGQTYLLGQLPNHRYLLVPVQSLALGDEIPQIFSK